MLRLRPAARALLGSALAALLPSRLPAQTGFPALDSAFVVFGERRFEDALPLFEQAVLDSPAHAVARCWLAETRRRLDQPADAARAAREALALDPRSSFAHAVLADCYDPWSSRWDGANADSAWVQIQKAVECDTLNGEAWLGLWSHAIARGDSARERESLRALSGMGCFTPAALAYNRWQLEFLPARAVLLTRGDADTYPAAMLQTISGVRTDVAIVSLGLLDRPDYAAASARRAGLPLPPGAGAHAPRDPSAAGAVSSGLASRIVAAWSDSVARGTLPRPLVVAASASRIGEGPPLRGRLTLAGPYYEVARDTGASADDLARLSTTVTAIDPAAFAGPWTSERDRSPIRMAGSGGLGANLLNAALRWGRAALDAGDRPAVLAAIAKLDSLTAVLGAGEVMRGKIRRLKVAAQR